MATGRILCEVSADMGLAGLPSFLLAHLRNIFLYWPELTNLRHRSADLGTPIGGSHKSLRTWKLSEWLLRLRTLPGACCPPQPTCKGLFLLAPVSLLKAFLGKATSWQPLDPFPYWKPFRDQVPVPGVMWRREVVRQGRMHVLTKDKTPSSTPSLY